MVLGAWSERGDLMPTDFKMKENGKFSFFKIALCWLAHLQQHAPQMLRNYLNNMELGHKGPVLGAVHTFILAGGGFNAIYPLPSSLPSPFSSQPYASPSPPVLPPSSGLLFSSASFPTSKDSGMEVRAWTLCVLVALQLRWAEAQAQSNYSR